MNELNQLAEYVNEAIYKLTGETANFSVVNNICSWMDLVIDIKDGSMYFYQKRVLTDNVKDMAVTVVQAYLEIKVKDCFRFMFNKGEDK